MISDIISARGVIVDEYGLLVGLAGAVASVLVVLLQGKFDKALQNEERILKK